MENISFLIALGAGILSPCVLPLVPSYLSFISGIPLNELSREKNNAKVKKIALLHSIIFILGFSLVFILLGTSASQVGKILLQYQVWIARIGGAFIIDWEGKVVGKAVGIRKWATEDSLDLIEYLLDKKETDSKNQ